MIKICFALIFILCPYNIVSQELSYALEAERTYEGEYYSFSIRLPKDWNIVENFDFDDGLQIIFQVEHNSNSFSIALFDLYASSNVDFESTISRTKFDKFIEVSLNDMQKTAAQEAVENFNAKIIDSGLTQFANKLSTRNFYVTEPWDGIIMYQEQWQFIQYAVIYTITKTTTADATENDIVLIYKSLATFKLNPIPLLEK